MTLSRFTLRDLFWLVLLVGAFLGGTIGCTSESERAARYSQEQLDQQLHQLKRGDTKEIYLYDTHGTDGLLEQIRGIVEVRGLALDLTDVSDDGMRHVATLPNLRWLSIYGGIGDQGLALLKGNQSITSLELTNTGLTDDGLHVLTELPNLRSLALSCEVRLGPRLSNAGLAHLKNLQNLENLAISGDWASEAAIDELRSEMPSCKIVTSAAGR